MLDLGEPKVIIGEDCVAQTTKFYLGSVDQYFKVMGKLMKM